MKKILLILGIFLCCGCSVTYNLQINKDLSVEEKVEALEGTSFFNEYPNSSVSRVIGFILEPNLDVLNKYGYNVYQEILSDKAGVIIDNKYSSLEEYANNTQLVSQFSDKVEITEKGNIVNIKVRGAFITDDQEQGRYPIDNGRISVYVPFTVTSHNADIVEGNVYTWIIKDSDKIRELSLSFKKKSLKDYIIYIVFGVIAAIIILGVIVTIMAGKANREANKI